MKVLSGVAKYVKSTLARTEHHSNLPGTFSLSHVGLRPAAVASCSSVNALSAAPYLLSLSLLLASVQEVDEALNNVFLLRQINDIRFRLLLNINIQPKQELLSCPHVPSVIQSRSNDTRLRAHNSSMHLPNPGSVTLDLHVHEISLHPHLSQVLVEWLRQPVRGCFQS